MVVIPSAEEEDLRRCHRERDRLIRERTAHTNRIKGLLFGQGIRGINVKSRYKTLQDIEAIGTGHRRWPALAGSSRPGDYTRDREVGSGAGTNRRGRA